MQRIDYQELIKKIQAHLDMNIQVSKDTFVIYGLREPLQEFWKSLKTPNHTIIQDKRLYLDNSEFVQFNSKHNISTVSIVKLDNKHYKIRQDEMLYELDYTKFDIQTKMKAL